MTAALNAATDEPPTPAVAVSDLTVGYGTVIAVDGASLAVEAAQLVAVLGSSGSGKTSMLRAIAGFVRPRAGTVSVGGRTLSDAATFVAPHRRRIGIVPQEGALFPHLDVAGNIGYGLNHLDRRERRRRVAELVDLVALGGLERRRPDQLSGGQQQRVALARALAPEPTVVLLDEPFSALDAGLRATVRAEVAGLLHEVGAAAVLVTHDAAEALSVADRIAVMAAGRIVQADSPQRLYQRPRSVEVARLLGAVNVVDAEADGATATTALGTVVLAEPASGAVQVLIRPEQIVPTTVGGVAATIDGRRFDGADLSLTIVAGGRSFEARWPLALVGTAVDTDPVDGAGTTVEVRGPVVVAVDGIGA